MALHTHKGSRDGDPLWAAHPPGARLPSPFHLDPPGAAGQSEARHPEIGRPTVALLECPRFEGSVVDECAPAFLTGTSTEYLGKRPLPRVVRERFTVIVLGPPRSGKTSVAWRFAGPEALYLSSRQLQDSLVARIRNGAWSQALLEAPALVLDGPVWLSNRRGAVIVLAELLRSRAADRRRTVVCQCDTDGSVTEVIGEMSPGSLVMIGLRFPMGIKGRLRFARRMCDDLGVPRSRARGTERLACWDYDEVVAALRRPAPRPGRRPPGAPAADESSQ